MLDMQEILGLGVVEDSKLIKSMNQGILLSSTSCLWCLVGICGGCIEGSGAGYSDRGNCGAYERRMQMLASCSTKFP